MSVECSHPDGADPIIGTCTVLAALENCNDQGVGLGKDQGRYREKVVGSDEGRRSQVPREDARQASPYRGGATGEWHRFLAHPYIYLAVPAYK
jgi:hypothetical protein